MKLQYFIILLMSVNGLQSFSMPNKGDCNVDGSITMADANMVVNYFLASDKSEQALSSVINSDTYQCLQDDATRLYYQSPRYVYSFLECEIKTGAIR